MVTLDDLMLRAPHECCRDAQRSCMANNKEMLGMMTI